MSNEKVTINNKEFVIADLPKEAQTIVNIIKGLETKKFEQTVELDNTTICISVWSQKLIDMVEPKKETKTNE